MSTGWRVLDFCSFEGGVRYERGQLVVSQQDAPPIRVPLENLAVVLISDRITISGAVLHKLADFDVAVLVCDWRGVPVSGMYPWSNHTRVGARHRAQVRLTLPRAKNAWGQLVRSKVLGQAATLRVTGRNGSDRLATLARGVRSGDPTNTEATAARVYWSRLFESGFSRIPGGENSWNGPLNYGYTVLRGHGIRAVCAAGLNPAVGVFHRGRSNAFNLVDDLIEPFRPAVDYVVANLEPGLSPEDAECKQRLVAASVQPFSADGYSVATCLESLAQQFGRYVEGEVDRLDVPAWAGPPEVDGAEI